MISSRHFRRDALLFVYGTLRPFVDVEVACWLRENARYVGPATVRGRLYDLGAYPGMQTARGRREHVSGDVYRITKPRVLRVLDRYEAGGKWDKPRFVRDRCVVMLDRRCRSAWLYRYRYSVVSAQRIASGDYRLHCQMRER
jgi:gamma-glutamylcyclotransferase (GGCT)/AIG2-like uncharacterized protein YtfP